MATILNEPADFRGKQLPKNYHELSYAWSNGKKLSSTIMKDLNKLKMNDS